MSTEDQDPQKPTEDQRPPKQYAGQRPHQPGERGTDERPPKTPDYVEGSEGDDENSTAAEQNADYRGAGQRQGGSSSSTKESPKPGGQGGHEGRKDSGKGSSGAGGGSISLPVWGNADSRFRSPSASAVIPRRLALCIQPLKKASYGHITTIDQSRGGTQSGCSDSAEGRPPAGKAVVCAVQESSRSGAAGHARP